MSLPTPLSLQSLNNHRDIRVKQAVEVLVICFYFNCVCNHRAINILKLFVHLACTWFECLKILISLLVDERFQ